MAKILLVSDSRGKRLKPRLTAPPDHQIDFIAKGGITLHDAMSITKKQLNNSHYICAYILAGICSITIKDEGSIYLPYDTKEEIVINTTRLIRNVLRELDDCFTIPIVLSTFPGVDLIKANNKNATGSHPQQTILNEAMVTINDFIVDLNLTRGFSTPMLSSVIHKSHGKRKDGSQKYRHHLSRLSDGTHPSDSTLNYWKKRLEEDFEQFTFDFEQL